MTRPSGRKTRNGQPVVEKGAREERRLYRKIVSKTELVRRFDRSWSKKARIRGEGASEKRARKKGSGELCRDPVPPTGVTGAPSKGEGRRHVNGVRRHPSTNRETQTSRKKEGPRVNSTRAAGPANVAIDKGKKTKGGRGGEGAGRRGPLTPLIPTPPPKKKKKGTLKKKDAVTTVSTDPPKSLPEKKGVTERT